MKIKSVILHTSLMNLTYFATVNIETAPENVTIIKVV